MCTGFAFQPMCPLFHAFHFCNKMQNLSFKRHSEFISTKNWNSKLSKWKQKEIEFHCSRTTRSLKLNLTNPS